MRISHPPIIELTNAIQTTIKGILGEDLDFDVANKILMNSIMDNCQKLGAGELKVAGEVILQIECLLEDLNNFLSIPPVYVRALRSQKMRLEEIFPGKSETADRNGVGQDSSLQKRRPTHEPGSLYDLIISSTNSKRAVIEIRGKKRHGLLFELGSQFPLPWAAFAPEELITCLWHKKEDTWCRLPCGESRGGVCGYHLFVMLSKQGQYFLETAERKTICIRGVIVIQ